MFLLYIDCVASKLNFVLVNCNDFSLPSLNVNIKCTSLFPSHYMVHEPPISFDGPQKLVRLTGLGLHVVRKMV